MTTATADQLLEMLGTIDETKNFLRKRCAAGQAGQSMGLFEDLASLLELLDSRYRKSGYLPREKVPVFGANADSISAVRYLDAIDDWSKKVHDRVKRMKVRSELARGGILEAAAQEGKPFVQHAVEMVQMIRSGTPEERAEMEKGVSVSFSKEAIEKARAGQEEAPELVSQPGPAPRTDKTIPNSLIDPAAEGARLFAGVRARAGGRAMPVVQASDPQPGEADPFGNAQLEARSMDARPMGTKEARPMGARPMGTKETPEARPMGARPMGAKETPEARPMGARPMGAKETPTARSEGTRAVQQPIPLETTTGPAVGRGISIDRDFLRLIHELGTITEEDLEKKLATGFPKLENRYKMVICDQVRKYGYWGRLEPDRGEFEILRRRAQELSRHRDEYSWLYGKLGDYRSRKTLLAILNNWYSYNFKDLANMKEKLFSPYLDADLLRCGEDEVFVDLGAGTGDVTEAFSKFAGHWKKIYCYEPQAGNAMVLKGRVRNLNLVDLRQSAVSDKAGEISLATSDDPLLSRRGDGGIKVAAVRLDEDIKEPVSIVKMCLEGDEQAAIRGCSDHIHKDHPRLALRADHGDSDLWQLPRMIERLDKKYRFYLRHYGGNLVPMEYVLYAI